MKKTQTWFLVLLGLGTLPLGAAQQFASSGFSAELADSGIPYQVKFSQTPLASNIFLNGEYKNPEGKTVSLYQGSHSQARARFERTGNECQVSIDSVLKTKEGNEIAKYKVREIWTPDKATFEYEATLCREISSQDGIFRTLVQMPESFFGCGVKETSLHGEENFKVLPKSYEKGFSLHGGKLSFAVEGKGVFTLESGENSKLALMDSRAWGGKDFSVIAGPIVPWSAKPVVRPAGTTWKWSFTLTFQKESK